VRLCGEEFWLVRARRVGVFLQLDLAGDNSGDGRNRRSIPLAYRLFLQESIKSPRSTAAVIPSSRFLTAALLEPMDFTRVQTVVELGCGTGAVTRAILRLLAPQGRLVALDTNKKFVQHLHTNGRDLRLAAVHASAEDLLSVLSSQGVQRVDAIVSSLGLTGMDGSQRKRILHQACTSLVPGGVMTQYQYLTSVVGHFERSKLRFSRFREKSFLGLFFREVCTRRVLLNFPPAVVFICRK